eukprot:CAMPEP_0167818664 /NCGR_PEP_ID=MMETSP0112_2-20121227/4933_1 /TAXON_ID=91324 /ORGANISM="Lotharella globosa, Strain CCCM811" /LENGTH=100 /DNA_ID=CAMNT_0007718679 /DNA_START=641 /DNA_END=942 /DNA_ORIENTATION=-
MAVYDHSRPTSLCFDIPYRCSFFGSVIKFDVKPMLIEAPEQTAEEDGFEVDAYEVAQKVGEIPNRLVGKVGTDTLLNAIDLPREINLRGGVEDDEEDDAS